jgi:hypothetical protein
MLHIVLFRPGGRNLFRGHCGESQARAPLPARHVVVHPPKKSVRASLALCTVRARTTAIAAPTRRAPARGAPGFSAAGKVPGDARSASRRLARARPPGRGERPATSTPGSGAVPAAGPMSFMRPASAAAAGAVHACSGAPRRHERRAGLQAGGPRPDVARRHSHAVRRPPSRRAANGMGLSLGARSNFFFACCPSRTARPSGSQSSMVRICSFPPGLRDDYIHFDHRWDGIGASVPMFMTLL